MTSDRSNVPAGIAPLVSRLVLTPNQCAYRAKEAARRLPHGQRPTAMHITIIFILARWQDNQAPHAKLARAARCHRNTVAAAFSRLRELGLLDWVPQYRTIGGQRFQTANRYLFVSNLAFPAAKPVSPGKGKKYSSLLGPQSLCTGEIRQISPVRTLAQIADRLRGGRVGPQAPQRTVAEQLAILLDVGAVRSS